MSVAAAIETQSLPDRVWIYSNYHCNLACAYCLTESSPRSKRRIIDGDQMIAITRQAAALGFREIGVTGGEPFLRPDIANVIAEMAEILPVTLLTNGTQFTGSRIRLTDPLVGRDVRLQISLDAPDAARNDELRGPENFAKVVDAVPRLVERGIRVRIATTIEPGRLSRDDHRRLCELHRSWGIDDDDHLVRPVLREGRADEFEMGERFGRDQLPPELTIAAHGAFWSAFGPTVRDDLADTHLLITRTILPLEVPATVLLRLVEGRPPGADAQIGIR